MRRLPGAQRLACRPAPGPAGTAPALSAGLKATSVVGPRTGSRSTAGLSLNLPHVGGAQKRTTELWSRDAPGLSGGRGLSRPPDGPG